MRRFGMVAVAVVFLLQAFAAASMPVMTMSADKDVVIICTGAGMKTVPLSDFGIEFDQDKEAPGTLPSGGMCVLCSLAHNFAIAPSVVFTPAVDLNAHAPQAPPVDRPILDGFRNVQQARAPPSNA
jgi:hypothetical protein